MISLDGTRPDDVTPERLPALVALAARGARAERLVPSFPTNTFPNHVTLVTGVAPERHGIVDNGFVDPERGRFEKQDIPSWIEVEPLWSLLAREGIVSASFYWVGSEGAWPGGAGPRYWKPFSNKTGEAEKVEQLLRWLDLPEPERPRFLTRVVPRRRPREPSARSRFSRGGSRAGAAGRGARGAVRRARRAPVVGVDDRAGGLRSRHDDPGAARRSRRRAPPGRSEGSARDGDRWVRERPRRRGAARACGRGGARSRARGLAARGGARLAAGGERSLRADRRRRAARRGDRPRASGDRRLPRASSGRARDVGVARRGGVRGVEQGAQLGVVENVDVAPTVLALFGIAPPAWMEGVPIAALLPGPGPARPRRRRRSEAVMRQRSRRALLLSLVLALPLASFGPLARAAEEPAAARKAAPAERLPTWYAATVAEAEKGGFVVVNFWSKGTWLRAEAVLAGRHIVTLVDATTYYVIDDAAGTGIAIERNAAARAQDATRGRPFANELADLLRRGGEHVGTEQASGQTVDVYRLTDETGRRTIWVSTTNPPVPLRIETFDRASETTRADRLRELAAESTARRRVLRARSASPARAPRLRGVPQADPGAGRSARRPSCIATCSTGTSQRRSSGDRDRSRDADRVLEAGRRRVAVHAGSR